MKKKLVVLTLSAMMAASMVACGNPQASLPEADETVIEVKEDETTGDEVVDAIVEELTSNNAFKGSMTSIAVYDSKGDEDDKEKAKIKVCVVSENDNATYTNYFVCTMKYSKEKKAWKVKEFAADEKKDASMEPKKGVDEATVEETITKSISVSNYYGDSYIDDASSKISSVEIKSDDFDKKNFTDKVVATYTVDGGFANYVRDITISYRFDESMGWLLDNYEIADTFEMEYSAETEEAFDAEKIMNDLAKNSEQYYLTDYSGNYYDLNKLDIEAMEVQDLSLDGNSATFNFVLNVITNDMEIELTLNNIKYYYDASKGWYLYNAPRNMTPVITSMDMYENEGFAGEYTGYDDKYDTIVNLVVTTVEKETYGDDYSVEGVVAFITSGGKQTNANFTGKFKQGKLLFTITTDAQLYYGDGRWDDIDKNRTLDFYLDLAEDRYEYSNYAWFSEVSALDMDEEDDADTEETEESEESEESEEATEE